MSGNGRVSMEAIKELRQRSGAGVLACRRALEEAGGNLGDAERLLARRAQEESARRAAQWTGEGYVASYIHHTGKLGALVELGCETDFVARTDEFRTLARQLAEQVAAMPVAPVGSEGPEGEDTASEPARPAGAKPSGTAAELMAQPWVRDPGRTVGELVQEAGARLGEAIRVRRIARLDLGEG